MKTAKSRAAKAHSPSKRAAPAVADTLAASIDTPPSETSPAEATAAEREYLFRIALQDRIAAARFLDSAAKLYGLAFDLWRNTGSAVSSHWPADCAFVPADFAILRDIRFGGWVLPFLIQDTLVRGGSNVVGSLEDRERGAWARFLD